MSTPNGALAGLKVVDFTRALAGPYCTMLLADQGANVIKIESPGTGDGTRAMKPFPKEVDDRKPFGGYFQSINRNKKSIVIDLKAESGKKIARRLAKDADVVVENFRPGVMESLGLSYESLLEVNPRLVYAAISGFGNPRTGKSPYHHWPAYDVIAQAMGGIVAINGPDPAHTFKVGPSIGDLMPATLAAFGIMSAVFHARETGEGQFMDIAMYDAVLAFCETIVYQYSYEGHIPLPEGNAHPLLCPYGLFPAKDGSVAIGCPGDRFWVVLARAMDREDMIKDERYRSNWARAQHADEVIKAVSDWSEQHTKKQLIDILGGEIPFGPVHDAADIFKDPHVIARDMLTEVEHPRAGKKLAIAGTPIKMTATPGGIRRRAPLLGEDTDSILMKAGYNQAEIAALRAEDVVS